jgi:uncharacterized protein (DUF697 family)
VSQPERGLADELADIFSRLTGGHPDGSRPELRDDIEELRRLVFARRAPRLCIVGQTDVPLSDGLNALGVSTGWEELRERLGHGRWYEHTTDLGTIEVADLRADDVPALQALEYVEPDAVVAMIGADAGEVDDQVVALADAMELSESLWHRYPAGAVAIVPTASARPTFQTSSSIRDALQAHGLPRDWVDTVDTTRESALPRALVRDIPAEARFALARISQDTGARRDVAFELIRHASAINAAIAAVPVPLASILPITSVQIAMVGGIAALAGRQPTVGTVAEFAAAVGINVGIGVAFRELARALIQWIPVAGPAVSASIAAGATLTVGRAAVRHYLHD